MPPYILCCDRAGDGGGAYRRSRDDLACAGVEAEEESEREGRVRSRTELKGNENQERSRRGEI